MSVFLTSNTKAFHRTECFSRKSSFSLHTYKLSRVSQSSSSFSSSSDINREDVNGRFSLLKYFNIICNEYLMMGGTRRIGLHEKRGMSPNNN